jgi:hypothetical protein
MEPTPTSPVRTWLKSNWIPLLAIVLVVVLAFVVGRGCESRAPSTATRPAQAPLTTKQVRQADARQQARQDSARLQDLVNQRVAKVRDSLVLASKGHKATYTRIIKSIAHEAPVTRPLPASRLAELLTNYTPQPYVLPSGDTIR